MKLTIATKNVHKADEFRLLFDRSDLDISVLPEGIPDAVEDGATFLENAVKKAVFYSSHVDGLVLSDDSGLVVPMLNGEPGIHSARYAGVHGDDQANNEKLISRLHGQGVTSAPGYFACALVVASRGEPLVQVEGRVPGTVYDEPKGANGFGYDPLFTPADYRLRYAEMSSQEKSLLSHRAMAVRMLVQREKEWLSR